MSATIQGQRRTEGHPGRSESGIVASCLLFSALLFIFGCAPRHPHGGRYIPLDGYVVSCVDSLGHETPAVHLTVPWKSLVFEQGSGSYSCHVVSTVVAERDGRRVGGGVADSTVMVPDYSATRSRRDLELIVPVSIRGEGLVALTASLEVARTSRRFVKIFNYNPQAGLEIPLYFRDFRWNLRRNEMGDALLGDELDSLLVDVFLGRRPGPDWPEEGLTLVGEVTPVNGGGGVSRAVFIEGQSVSGSTEYRLSWDATDLPFGPLQLTVVLYGGSGDESEFVSFDPPRHLVNLSIRWRDDRAWKRHMSLLQGLLEDSALEQLEHTRTQERAAAWRRFWEAVGEAEGISGNVALHRHLDRIVEADRRYGVFGRGGISDRGRAWVRYGEPDRIETWGDDLSRESRWEVWEYYGLRLRLVFLDTHGMGDYYLYERRIL